jgi:NAD(P)-dependent dehydrogenase (short-subunit alcohol dehydrogenase family)
MFGEPVVHGMHAVAWAVEQYLADLQKRGMTGLCLRRLSASFSKPVFLRETVGVSLIEETPESALIRIGNRQAAFIDVKLRGEPGTSPRFGPESVPGVYSRVPKGPSLHDLRGLSGAVQLCYEGRALRQDFPVSCEVLGGAAVARLLGLSRLVGMECPGLNSLFSSFECEIGPDDDDIPVLRFTVEHVDPRVSAVRIRLGGAGLRGTVNAFLRPTPTEQASVETVARMVGAREFADQRALVVGGSRGLGEAMAKIIACGNGHPVITYRQGEDDAKRVTDEIIRWGGICDMIRFDVANPRRPLLELKRKGWIPTHLYYFASPRIFVRKSTLFDEQVFRRFLAVYVDGFLRTYSACRDISGGLLRVFYPSSIAVEENLRELTEYAAAKVAGEMLCHQVERFGRDTRVLVERLPRIRTDQTATLLNIPAAEASEILLGTVRRLAAIVG